MPQRPPEHAQRENPPTPVLGTSPPGAAPVGRVPVSPLHIAVSPKCPDVHRDTEHALETTSPGPTEVRQDPILGRGESSSPQWQRH